MDQRIDTAARGLFKHAVEYYQHEHKQGRTPVVPATVAFFRLNDDDKAPSAAIMPLQMSDQFFNVNGKYGKQHLMYLIKKALTGEVDRQIPWPDGKRGECKAAIVIVEAYMKAEDDKKKVEEYEEGSLAADPDATECIMLQIHSLEGTRIVMQPVKEGFLMGDIKEFGAGVEDGGEMTGKMAMPLPQRH